MSVFTQLVNIWILIFVLTPRGYASRQLHNSSCLAEHSSWHMEEEVEHDTQVFLQNVARADKQRNVSVGSTSQDNPREVVALTLDDDGLLGKDLVDKPRQFPSENYYYDMCAVVTVALLTGVIGGIYIVTGRELIAFGQPLAKNGDARQDLLDNAKFFLVAMVILHHTGRTTPGFGMRRHYLLKPYIFHSFCTLHTRALCFVSGILSRGKLKADKVLIYLLGPFLGYCIFIAPCEQLILSGDWPNPLKKVFASGFHVQWYLLGLIWWRSIGAVLGHFRTIPRIMAAFLIASMACYVQTDFLSLRTLQWLPIFVAGQLFPYEQTVSKCPWRPALALLGVATIVTIGVARFSFKQLVIPADGIFEGGENQVFNPVMYPLIWTRVVAWNLLQIFKSIVFVILICPRSRTPFTEAGEHSIYPYLLHRNVLCLLGKVSSKIFLSPDIAFNPWVVSIALALGDFSVIIGLCYCLSTWPVRALFHPLIEPSWLRIFFVPDQQAGG